MKISENTVIDFIQRNFSGPLLADEKFNDFHTLVTDGKEIAAAKAYCDITGSSIDEARLAIVLIKAKES